MKTHALHPYLARQRLVSIVAITWLVLLAFSLVWNWRQSLDSAIMFAMKPLSKKDIAILMREVLGGGRLQV